MLDDASMGGEREQSDAARALGGGVTESQFDGGACGAVLFGIEHDACARFDVQGVRVAGTVAQQLGGRVPVCALEHDLKLGLVSGDELV